MVSLSPPRLAAAQQARHGSSPKRSASANAAGTASWGATPVPTKVATTSTAASSEPAAATSPRAQRIRGATSAGLWIDARFDQSAGGGLRPGLPAMVVLRSREDRPLPGAVLRLEPLADAVTEESRAKIAFTTPPAPLPPLGELAEVTVQLPALPPAANPRFSAACRSWGLAGSRARTKPNTGYTGIFILARLTWLISIHPLPLTRKQLPCFTTNLFFRF